MGFWSFPNLIESYKIDIDIPITYTDDYNNLVISKVVSVLFTVTKDLNAAFPAKAVRDLGYDQIPALDSLAPDIEGDLLGCIRVLVIYQDNIEPNHVYLGEAKNLRPDR